jgi:hypothetical protein
MSLDGLKRKTRAGAPRGMKSKTMMKSKGGNEKSKNPAEVRLSELL